MVTTNLDKYVKRYTTLSCALETLTRKKVVLLSPSKWDDSNDVLFMDLYRDHIAAKSVLALCCTMAAETYHHWRIFTQGIEGVCIEFERESLSVALEKRNIVARAVEYVLIRDLKRYGAQEIDRLPFVKRRGYSDEREWRAIAKCTDEIKEFLDVPINLTWINRLVLNPWMPPSLVDNLRSIIKKIDGCSSLKVESSRLTNSKAWKDAGRRLRYRRQNWEAAGAMTNALSPATVCDEQ